MLNTRTRRQLREHKLLNLENHTSNPSQKLKRLRELSITGLGDLALIAGETTDGIQDQVFTSSKFEPMIDRILKLEFRGLSNFPPSVNRLDPRRTQLCAMLVSKCITFLKLQYEFLEHDSPGLADIVLGQLSQAAKISNEIANKVELLNLQNVASKTKLEYLFNWKKVTEKNEKLWSLLYGELGVPFNIETINRSPDGRVLKFKLVLEYVDVIPSVTITINGEGNTAKLLIPKGSTKIERELIVRKVNDELYLFKRINNS